MVEPPKKCVQVKLDHFPLDRGKKIEKLKLNAPAPPENHPYLVNSSEK